MHPLDYIWEGNRLWEWGTALLLAALALSALYVAKGVATRRLAALAKTTEIFDVVVHVLNATGLWLFLPAALYAGSLLLELPRRLDHGLTLLTVVTLLIQVALWLNRCVDYWFARLLRRRREDDAAAATTLALLSFSARAVLWGFVLLLALHQLGFNITALLAGLGVGGVAVALAVQNILGDLFASLSIMLDKPFVIDDFIIVGEHMGTVEHIGLKTTRVRSLGGELIVFSNTDLLKSRIRNYKRMYERRVQFAIGITYETPVAMLERIPSMLREIVRAQQRTRFDRAHFKEYGDSSLIFEVVYYVLDADYNVYMDIQQAINLEIFRRFEREGIEFAYPTQSVYLRGPAPLDANRVATRRPSRGMDIARG